MIYVALLIIVCALLLAMAMGLFAIQKAIKDLVEQIDLYRRDRFEWREEDHSREDIRWLMRDGK